MKREWKKETSRTKKKDEKGKRVSIGWLEEI
jgi:hypothetical protein